jgi:ketosteroid isomerase-like protein
MQATEKDLKTRNKQTVQAGFDAWRNGTGSPFDLLAADATWTIVGNAPVSRTHKSKQEFMDVVINPFNARMSRPLIPTSAASTQTATR